MKIKTITKLHVLLFLALVIVSLTLDSCKKEVEDETPSNPELLLLTPTNLKIVDVGVTIKKITWDFNYINIEGFKVDRKVNNNEWETAFLISSKDIYQVTDSLVIPDSTLLYNYRVYAYSGNSVSLFSIVQENFSVPAPENADVSNVNDVVKKLSWEDQAVGETAYKIDRKIAGGEWQIEHKVLPANTELFYDSIAQKTHEIQYRVYSSWNNYNSISKSMGSDGLGAPEYLTLDVLDLDKIEISWRDRSSGELGFRIDRMEQGKEWEISYGEVVANQQNFIDTKAKCGVNYKYRVYAFAGPLNSNYLEGDINIEFEPPSNIQLSLQNLSRISISWNDNTDMENSYHIDRKTGDNPWEISYAQVAENMNHWSDVTFPLGEVLLYRVYAVAENCISDPIQKSISSDIPPPSNLTLYQPNEDQIILTWEDNCTGEQGFKIDRKIGTTGTWQVDYAEVDENILSFTDNDAFTHGDQYYYRIYAYKDWNQSSGNVSSIIAFVCGNTFQDQRDGQYYNTIKINDQCWFAENLNYESSASWWYLNSANNGDNYGRLYTWYAAKEACPSGWHLPSDTEWKILELGLGMSQSEVNSSGWRGTDEGGKLKESGTTHWDSPNIGATNSSGFSAGGGGYRLGWNHIFYNGRYAGYWFSSSEISNGNVWGRSLRTDESQIRRTELSNGNAYSIRCIKD